jgi:hypothetical protein
VLEPPSSEDQAERSDPAAVRPTPRVIAGVVLTLFRLKRFGLIDEIEGQKIGDMLDGKKFKLRSFVRLTSQGERFIRALNDIERS